MTPPQSNNSRSSKDQDQWVQEVLEPEQLSGSKKRFPLKKLSPGMLVIFWALRVYVLVMIALICFEVWNVVHSGGK
jgi:hypothetical protein